MKTPRDLNGETLAQHLSRAWAYARIHQTGSHIVLQTKEPTPHRISIPAHKPLKTGTLHKILTDVAGHKAVSREEILRGL